MNRKTALIWACVLMLGLTLCAHAAAQEPDDAEEELDDIDARRDKILEKMQAVRAWKLAEVLELNDKNGPKLLASLASYDERIFAAHIELRKAERRLKKAFHAGAPDKELEAGLARAIAARKKADALRYEQLEKAGATLDVRRRVKLYHFLPQFEKEMRRRLREARGPKGRGGNGGFDGPPGDKRPRGRRGRRPGG